ncbi:thioredoxin [Porcipelethomonas sp.]|uniref:thioredoxin n=1 Tax=Porcipelethomonas sp. TaxID=2981675 RepID=UPI003EFA050F
MIVITKENFKKEVTEYKGKVLLDFWAEWCGPCKMTAPVFEELSEQYGSIKFGKVNVDQQKDIAAEYNIMSIPTFILFEDGVAVKQLSGAYPAEEIVRFFGIY